MVHFNSLKINYYLFKYLIDPMLQATELATQLLGAQEAICCVIEDLSAQDFADLRCHHQRSSLMLVSAQLQ